MPKISSNFVFLFSSRFVERFSAPDAV